MRDKFRKWTLCMVKDAGELVNIPSILTKKHDCVAKWFFEIEQRSEDAVVRFKEHLEKRKEESPRRSNLVLLLWC